MAEITFKVAMITSSMTKMTFVVSEITLKMAVITSSVVKITFEKGPREYKNNNKHLYHIKLTWTRSFAAID